jgi:hypothetical protein
MPEDKDVAWLHGEIKPPPFAADARIEAGWLLRLRRPSVTLDLP